MAHLVVRRSGNLHGDVSFTWWTESGTAKPGHDFASVAAHEEVIPSGKNTANLFVSVVRDATRKQPKSFYVVISDPTPIADASLGPRTLAMVTLSPSE
jgi:hypothetical protein